MKREDIARIFEGATKEQIDQIMAINGADVNAAKSGTDKLKIDAYEQAEAQRKADEKAAAEYAELMERLDAALGDRKFIHDRMRDVVAADFADALKDKANRGKSDKEIFDSLTRDQGYFASQNPPPANMAQMGGADEQMDAEKFRKMSLYDQFVFANEHPEEASLTAIIIGNCFTVTNVRKSISESEPSMLWLCTNANLSFPCPKIRFLKRISNGTWSSICLVKISDPCMKIYQVHTLVSSPRSLYRQILLCFRNSLQIGSIIKVGVGFQKRRQSKPEQVE